MLIMSRLVRPCPIDKELYHKFSDKCRNNDEEIGEILDALMELYLGDKLRLPAPSKRKINRIARPTFVNKKIYIEFGNKCRLNGIETADTLERVLKRYIKNRDNLPLIIRKKP